jgi:hypothetical protein
VLGGGDYYRFRLADFAEMKLSKKARTPTRPANRAAGKNPLWSFCIKSIDRRPDISRTPRPRLPEAAGTWPTTLAIGSSPASRPAKMLPSLLPEQTGLYN